MANRLQPSWPDDRQGMRGSIGTEHRTIQWQELRILDTGIFL